jgi:hypothetical protein
MIWYILNTKTAFVGFNWIIWSLIKELSNHPVAKSALGKIILPVAN